jgi:phenylpropionate dioxygenase-like ring-hydroxylating dioxygenase large terminal subunit
MGGNLSARREAAWPPKTVNGDALGHEGLPVHEYNSAEQYEKEKNIVWKNSWLIMGREADIPKPGDYTVTELSFLSLSILIVRGKDNVLRAFYNACRHCGMSLCSELQGSLKSIGCHFHGWVYDLKGQLVNVPFEDHFVDLPKNDLGLVPIATELWGGFIFVNLAPKPEIPLAEYLAPLPKPLHDYFAREHWQWYYGFKYPLRANWKIIIDVQHEGYHVNFLHAEAIEPGFAASDMPVWAYPDARGYSRSSKS